MKTGGTNLFVLTMSAFWSSSRWPLDRFHCITQLIAIWYKLFPWAVIVSSYSGILKIQFSPWPSRQTELWNRNSMTHKHFICGSLEFTMVVILNYGLSRTCVSGGVYKSFDTKWGVDYSNWAIWGYRTGVPLGYEIPSVRVFTVVWDCRTSESRVQQQKTSPKLNP